MLALLLALAHQACSQSEPEATSPFVWQPADCDSTAVVDTLQGFDLAMPFYPDDTLAPDSSTPVRVFAVVLDRAGKTRWAGVATDSAGKPQLLTTASPAGWEPLRLTGVEQTYLRALVDQPEYLYTRWESLLVGARSQFLARRDSLLDSLRKVYPSYTLRILNDLRSAGLQAKFLKRGSSNAPLSQHQFGLAVDVGILSKGKLLRGYNTYAAIGRLCPRYGLTWGGTFVGFVDPNHFQAVKNSAALVRLFPELRFEFEPYRPHYLRRVRSKLAEGKEDEVLDTEELLQELNLQRRQRPCPCDSAAAPPPAALANVQRGLAAAGYQPAMDILLFGDLSTQTLTATRGSVRLTYRLGKWR